MLWGDGSMTGSGSKAGGLGPFQTAMKVHHSLHSSTSPRSTKQQSTKLRSEAQRTKPRTTMPQGIAPRLEAHSHGSSHVESHDDSRKCLEDPGHRPLRALQLPLTGNKASSSNTQDSGPCHATHGDPSLTPPRVRAPLRAAATRAESSYSPEVPRKGVGPLQASASLFQKKKEHSRSSKSRHHRSHHTHSSSRSSKQGTKAQRAHLGHDWASAERCRSGDSSIESQQASLPDVQRLPSDSSSNASYYTHQGDEREAAVPTLQQQKHPVPMLQHQGTPFLHKFLDVECSCCFYNRPTVLSISCRSVWWGVARLIRRTQRACSGYVINLFGAIYELDCAYRWSLWSCSTSQSPCIPQTPSPTPTTEPHK